MRWQAHLFIGFFCGFAAFLILGDGYFWALCYAALSGACALLPDLDLRKSKGSQVLNALALLAAVVASIYLAWRRGAGFVGFLEIFAVLLLVLLAIDWFLRPRHRTIFHSTAAALALAVVCFFLFGWQIALACAIGYVSHLILDR